jgi:hypothetical protein
MIKVTMDDEEFRKRIQEFSEAVSKVYAKAMKEVAESALKSAEAYRQLLRNSLFYNCPNLMRRLPKKREGK